MVTSPVISGAAFGVRVRHPAQRGVRCWIGIAPSSETETETETETEHGHVYGVNFGMAAMCPMVASRGHGEIY